MDMKIIKPLSSSISALIYGNVQNKDVGIRDVDSKTVNLNFFISLGDHNSSDQRIKSSHLKHSGAQK